LPVRIVFAPLWLAATNCYVVSAGDGGPGVIVDAPPDPGAIAEVVRRTGAVPQALLLTHGHLDHVGGAGGVVAAFGVTAHLHPADEWLGADLEGQARMLLGIGPSGEFAGAERYEPLADGAVLDLAGLRFRVIHTPGHTPGHCCFWLEDEGVLFSGDHLFAGSIGRTDLPGGDYATLMRSMAERVVPLPAATDVLPGHGPATTLAQELAMNPFLQDLPR
jgi:glyoxylase-like metal-dependent hydrolase (beta-lactamase superfamily II)